jgi:hypothetical protein
MREEFSGLTLTSKELELTGMPHLPVLLAISVVRSFFGPFIRRMFFPSNRTVDCEPRIEFYIDPIT